MNAEFVAQTIQLILTPAVMVTTCAIMLGGLLAHYGAINDRLRALARERLEIWQSSTTNLTATSSPDSALPGDSAPSKHTTFITERLREIDTQLPDLLRRHTMMRNAVLSGYAAVVSFLTSMVIIALAALIQSTIVAFAALLIFLAGTTILLIGMLLTTIEIRISHQAVQYETRRIASLDVSQASLENTNLSMH
jgi:hypothetical protein